MQHITGYRRTVVTTVLACVDDATGGAPADPPAAKVERSGRGVAGADVLARWVTLGAEPGVAPGRVERVRALLNTDDRFHGVDSLAGVAPPALVELRDAPRAYVESCRPGALAELALRHPVVVTFPDGAARLASAPGAGATAAACADVLAAVQAHLSGDGPASSCAAAPTAAGRATTPRATARDAGARWGSVVT